MCIYEYRLSTQESLYIIPCSLLGICCRRLARIPPAPRTRRQSKVGCSCQLPLPTSKRTHSIVREHILYSCSCQLPLPTPCSHLPATYIPPRACAAPTNLPTYRKSWLFPTNVALYYQRTYWKSWLFPSNCSRSPTATLWNHTSLWSQDHPSLSHPITLYRTLSHSNTRE